jgi:hypothetical protein
LEKIKNIKTMDVAKRKGNSRMRGDEEGFQNERRRGRE